MTDGERKPDAPSTATQQAARPQDDEKQLGGESFIKEAGSALIHSFFTASKTIQLYELNNEAVKRSLSEFVEATKRIIRNEGKASLRISAEFLYINDVRIPMDSQTAGPYLYLIEEMKKRGVEAFEFHPDLEVEEVGSFLKTFFEIDEAEDAFEELQDRMRQSSIRNLDAMPWIERERRLTDAKQERKDIRSESNMIFFRTVHLMRGILQAIEEKHVIQVKKAKRLTQQMTDIIQTDESILVGLTSIKDFDEYTYAHSVNVCILSMLTGDRLKLYKQELARLGLAALFHDIGKVHIPSSIVYSTTTLSESDWELMKYHTFFGVVELARVKALNEIVDAMFVALQHHVHYDMNGYPQKPEGWELRLFTKIVTVADYYDAMTSSRSYRKVPVTPDKALRFIMEKSGKIFDPVIAKTFVQAMGIYPIGTVVELDTGERGVVVKQNPQSRYIHRPSVQIIDPGTEEKGPLVNLTERADGECRYRRSILRALYDLDAGVDKHSYFITE
ncbi:MAG: HD domain-containing protein [Candidatus Latescibacteria bacterium]|nr:HD domain-containing protein [Candidatus Latescibacterota bacterium]NIM21969.1 HD domain-containing protein [Candidatus Latescibacterota bacterium]NIM65987.1 HD domain-containing protein [Candidatus Latescibacterota bacterium]NIO02395.1 HD domain-containing protein [Candidatus Latescibacterota bacterium]NIO29305.1 HD domain-containing protein [Candidatus Latescibacterota bacterium]